MQKLRLFVWNKFSPDYTDGLAFAIAPTIQEAKRLVAESLGYEPSDYAWGECSEYPANKPFAAACVGGS